LRPIIQKFNAFRSKKLTDSARGQPCQNCDAEDDTTVSAHSNWSEHGKGSRIKAADCFIAHLCVRCHAWLDQGSGTDPTGRWQDTDKREMWRAAADKTLLRLFLNGTLKVA
jgi:hypothetical protein